MNRIKKPLEDYKFNRRKRVPEEWEDLYGKEFIEFILKRKKAIRDNKIVWVEKE